MSKGRGVGNTRGIHGKRWVLHHSCSSRSEFRQPKTQDKALELDL
jgi:hypothetical protein